MKSKIKRHSRSALAVILTLSMLVSCMMVGLIATDAARVTDSGTVGATADDESVGGATDYYWNYQKDMPDGNYSASNHQALTQSSKATNKYYYIATLDTSSTYGMYMSYGGYDQNDKHYKPSTNFDAESNAAYKLTDKGVNNNYGNNSNREKYTTNSSDTQYIVTWDSTQNELYMSPTSAGVELRWDVQAGHTNYYNLDHTETMTQAADGYTYTCDVSLTGGTPYYLFNKVGQYYYRGTSTLTTDSFVQVYSYQSKENYGGSADKLSYTPATTGTYRFTWDNRDKTLSVALASASTSTYSLTGDIWNACVTQINGSTNTISRGSEDDPTWWGSYHADAAVNTTESANVYSITIKTADRDTLNSITPNPFTTVDIGLYKKDVSQKAFKIGNTYYNYIGGDYKVTSSGVTADIVNLAAQNGGGALKLQPDRTYKITINEGVTPNTISVECTSGDKYFLAGQYSDGTTQFFGETWNTSNNELVYNSLTGKYELEFTENIPAGTIKFKTVKNGDSDGWDGGSYPTKDQTYVINANATKVKFAFDANNNTMTVTQENSGGGEGGTWPPTDTAVTNVTESSTSTGKYLLVSNNDQFETNGSNTMTAVALSNKYETDSNAYYWADLTNYLNYNNIHIILSAGSNKNDAKNFGSDSKVNDKDFILKDSNNNYLSRDKYDYYDGSTKLFHAEGKDNNDGNVYFRRVEINQKHSSLNHLGVLIRTDKDNPSSNWIEYSFFYTDYVPPVVETKVVDIYAKNGTLRDSNYNRFTNLANTEILDYFYYEETNATTGEVTTYTSITGDDGYNAAHSGKEITIEHDKLYGDSNYDKMTNVPVGAKIKLRTYLSGDTTAAQIYQTGKAFKDTHYLKAYSFNGMTYEVHDKSEALTTDLATPKFTAADEYYEEVWTVRAVNTTYKDSNGVLQNATTDGKTIEVTPIYYMKDNSNCKTFYIDGYDGEVQSAWGNLLCVYPYYEGIKEKGNAFGGYPGQPMLFWGGKYQMEIPLTVDGTSSGASVKGLTMHNSFWDLFHRSKDIRCNARNHAQTYDYDDFYKLYKEKNPDTIIFDYKYRTKHDNYGDDYQYTKYDFADNTTAAASKYAASNYNGVEVVTDYFGRQVDVFGNLLTDSQKSDYDTTKTQDKELLIVSTGYKDTYVGEYATLWAVYAPQSDIPAAAATAGDTAGKFIGLISSSELYLNTWDNASRYPVSDHGLLMTESRFENTYKHLKKYYTGVPALITYEKEIWNNSKDKANRSDGKWYYSNKSDKISASIKIQYGSHTLLNAPDHSVSSDQWRDDPFNTTTSGVNGGFNIGSITDCSAYFTNTTPDLLGMVESGEQFADSTKNFSFQAVASGSYVFAGWVRYSNGKYYEITENEIGESPMSANDVYIARFVDAQTGSLTVQHVVEQTGTYTGKGIPSVTVLVKNGNDVVNTENSSPVTDGSKIDISKWIKSAYRNYTIDISLTTTPDSSSESMMEEIVSNSGNFAASPATFEHSTSPVTATVAQFTVQQVLDSGITSLRYVSHLSKASYTYKYEITYHYTSRFWGAQSYTVEGAFTKVVDGNTVPDESAFAANTTGVKTDAQLNDGFIINKTPYEKNFRKTINWNYTYQQVEGANAMTNAKAVSDGENTYKMVAHVYSANSVNDQVMAEFILPYKYNYSSDSGYSAAGTDVYTAATDGAKVDGASEVVFDESIEGSKRKTQAYKLFTYNDTIATGGDDIRPSTLKLVEAAPYVLKNVTNHTVTDYNVRYFSGSDKDYPDTVSFVVESNNTTTRYWLKYYEEGKYDFKKPDGAEGIELTASNTDTDDSGTRYTYAVKVDDVIYQFVNVGEDGVMYSVRTPYKKVDGVVQDTGTKKYFTRWDIYNSKGEFVASSYNRYFNYTGYDNYVVKAIYESERENQFEYDNEKPISASITYLDDSRNQWNRNGVSGYEGGGNYATVTGQDALYAADKLFADFAITYNYNGLNINTVKKASEGGADIKVGMVIERLDVLDSVGTSKITNASHYADKYKDNESWKAIENALEGDGKISDAVKAAEGGSGHSCYHQKIASNCGASGYGTLGGTPAENSPTALMGFNSAVDNFNRLQMFYTFNNTTQKTSSPSDINTATMKNYAYRAISYIMVGNNAYLCDSPTYFTIYDTATRTSY